MVAAAIRRYRTAALIALWVAFVLGALLLLALTARNSAQFGRLQPWILLFSIATVLVLTYMLVRKIVQLVRDYRAHVPGSRLATRTALVFGMIVIVPLVTIYLFSLEFINRSVDSWFRVEVTQGLNDAVDLSRAALNLRMREHAQRVESFARGLAAPGGATLAAVLDEERRLSGARDLVLYGAHGRVMAASSASFSDPMTLRPARDVLNQVREGRVFLTLEPVADGAYVIRIAAPVRDSPASGDRRFVLALFEVPPQLAALADAVQRSYSDYGDLAALRGPLKTSFRLTLTLVLLVTLLAAIYGAIYSAERLFKPVQDLMEGTRAVAKGDFGTRLPLTSRDEMGFLVQSFNEMTKRLRRAREEATRSQLAVENERERLAVILARLSTGVFVVDGELQLRSANEAAGTILGADFSSYAGQPLAALAAAGARAAQFVNTIDARLRAGRQEWREQLDLTTDSGRRSLMCACVPLPAGGDERGYVIVFDDITTLLDAQRDAAWGEVARRLAHEIKNPLTPIQLSAERIRRRFLSNMSPADAEMLEKSTHTIVQQVEAMKQMVNAFSEYARAPDMHYARFGLNELVSEVVELYRAQEAALEIRLQLDPRVAAIEADRGRIRQILNNLLTNAIEALDSVPKGRIEVRTELVEAVASSYASVVVSDNGPGIARDMLDHVFEPYVTSKPKGTGLGLAIVKKIVEEHGGRIEAENRPEGGAQMRVLLPVNDSSRAAARRERRGDLRRERA